VRPAVNTSWKKVDTQNGSGTQRKLKKYPNEGPKKSLCTFVSYLSKDCFALQVWRDWALSRNRKPETKLEKFGEVPVDIRVADTDVMSYWLPKFIKEVRNDLHRIYKRVGWLLVM